MSSPSTDTAFAFNLSVGSDALPFATMDGSDTAPSAMPPLSAEESDQWVADALFECYNG